MMTFGKVQKQLKSWCDHMLWQTSRITSLYRLSSIEMIQVTCILKQNWSFNSENVLTILVQWVLLSLNLSINRQWVYGRCCKNCPATIWHNLFPNRIQYIWLPVLFVTTIKQCIENQLSLKRRSKDFRGTFKYISKKLIWKSYGWNRTTQSNKQ